MASLIERNNRYYVVYTYENEAGEKKQKWETYRTKTDAQRRKSEVEYRQELGSVVVPQCETMSDLLIQCQYDQFLYSSASGTNEAWGYYRKVT